MIYNGKSLIEYLKAYLSRVFALPVDGSFFFS